MQRKYLQAVQQNVDSSSKKEALQNFLDQRKEVAMEIDIRGLEEERRKAEEDLAKVFTELPSFRSLFTSFSRALVM